VLIVLSAFANREPPFARDFFGRSIFFIRMGTLLEPFMDGLVEQLEYRTGDCRG